VAAGPNASAVRHVAGEVLLPLTAKVADALTVEYVEWSTYQQSLYARQQLVEVALVAPSASLGNCSAHGRDLWYEGRDDGLWVSCGAGCEYKIASK
jgi:hypothetical protein